MAMSPLAMAMAQQGPSNPAQTPIQPADVLGAYKLSSDVAEKNYQAKLAQMQAMWGGLASLGAAGAIGFGPTLAKKYFGTQAANAGSSAAPTVTSGVDAATGNPVAASSTSWAAPDAVATAPEGAGGGMFSDLMSAGGAPEAAYSLGDIAPSVAPSIAADYGLTGAADAGLGALGAGGAGAGSVAAALAPEAAAGEAAAAGLPEWLTSFLPFLL